MRYKTTLIKHSGGKFMAKIPQDEILLSIKDLTPKAYQLLMYYYSKQDGWVFNDSDIASTLDSTDRMIKKYRKELIENGYLYIIKGKVTIYLVGRRAVREFSTNESSIKHNAATGEVITRGTIVEKKDDTSNRSEEEILALLGY